MKCESMKQIGRITYEEMIRVAFSPSDMGDDSVEPRMPSSQPYSRASANLSRADQLNVNDGTYLE